MHKPNRPPPSCEPPGNGVVPRGYDPGWPCGFQNAKKPRPDHWKGLFNITSLTITYFHTGCSTIIGAELFLSLIHI